MELIWPHPITPMLVLLVVSKGTILFLYKSSERDGPCDRSGWLTDIISASSIVWSTIWCDQAIDLRVFRLLRPVVLIGCHCDALWERGTLTVFEVFTERFREVAHC